MSGATVTFVGAYTATMPVSIIVSYGTVSGITPAAGGIGMVCMDDIYIGGRTPVTLYVESANVVASVIVSNGSMQEQQLNTLVYAPPLTLTTVNGVINAITLTAPATYVKLALTSVIATSYVELHVAR